MEITAIIFLLFFIFMIAIFVFDIALQLVKITKRLENLCMEAKDIKEELKKKNNTHA